MSINGRTKVNVFNTVYEGTFKDGYIVGIGTCKSTRGFYTGEFAYGGDEIYQPIEGKGKMEFTNGDVYEGEWKRNSMHGHGKMVLLIEQSQM